MINYAYLGPQCGYYRLYVAFSFPERVALMLSRLSGLVVAPTREAYVCEIRETN